MATPIAVTSGRIRILAVIGASLPASHDVAERILPGGHILRGDLGTIARARGAVLCSRSPRPIMADLASLGLSLGLHRGGLCQTRVEDHGASPILGSYQLSRVWGSMSHLVGSEPLYKGGLEGLTPGSSCIANAYSNNHDKIASKETGPVKRAALHVVDALSLVHAMILRLQALVFPFKTLVFGGH